MPLSSSDAVDIDRLSGLLKRLRGVMDELDAVLQEARSAQTEGTFTAFDSSSFAADLQVALANPVVDEGVDFWGEPIVAGDADEGFGGEEEDAESDAGIEFVPATGDLTSESIAAALGGPEDAAPVADESVVEALAEYGAELGEADFVAEGTGADGLSDDAIAAALAGYAGDESPVDAVGASEFEAVGTGADGLSDDAIAAALAGYEPEEAEDETVGGLTDEEIAQQFSAFETTPLTTPDPDVAPIPSASVSAEAATILSDDEIQRLLMESEEIAVDVEAAQPTGGAKTVSGMTPVSEALGGGTMTSLSGMLDGGLAKSAPGASASVPEESGETSGMETAAPMASVPEGAIDLRVAERVPGQLAVSALVAPVAIEGQTLRAWAAEPFDADGIAAIQEATGLTVQAEARPMVDVLSRLREIYSPTNRR